MTEDYIKQQVFITHDTDLTDLEIIDAYKVLDPDQAALASRFEVIRGDGVAKLYILWTDHSA